jgi:hypothetical protein
MTNYKLLIEYVCKKSYCEEFRLLGCEAMWLL